MAYENAAFDATIAAAAGDDVVLMKELRCAFIDSVTRQLDFLKRSRCDGNWELAAMRLQGLAVSFHSERLIDAAEEVLQSAPGEPAAIKRIEGVLTELSGREP